MAENSANDIVWYVQSPTEHKDALSDIRPWDNLKVGFEGQETWVTGFSFTQIESLEIKSNPYVSVFYAKGAKLFPKNSQLPARNIPALLWTPIQRAFPIKLPSFNHNYFGIKEQITLQLIPSEQEVESIALLTSLDLLEKYLMKASSIRLRELSWIRMGASQALILGRPFLPIKGKAFWPSGDMLLTAGYDFDLPVLAGSLNQKLNPARTHWILWEENMRYTEIRKEDFKPLSLSSLRLTQDKPDTLEIEIEG